MRSPKQQAAARQNGARSHGPVTDAGKARSSQNARRHGFLSRMVITGAESEEGLREILDQHLHRFSNLDGVEFGMLEEMAVAYWRMRRAWAVEKEWMDRIISSQPDQAGITTIASAFGNLADSNKYKVLHRYESRMHRIYQRSLKTLFVLQDRQQRRQPDDPAENSKNNQTNPSLDPPQNP